MATDVNGREYARLSLLKSGDKVQVDGDFTCMKPWTVKTVCKDEGGLYLECEEIAHYLVGQLMNDGDSLVGVYLLNP